MSPETGDQTVLERLPQLTEMRTEPIYTVQSPNDLANTADAALPDPDDSEAETERLHLSPTKKRLATEIELENLRKKAKLAGRDCLIALSGPTEPVGVSNAVSLVDRALAAPGGTTSPREPMLQPTNKVVSDEKNLNTRSKPPSSPKHNHPAPETNNDEEVNHKEVNHEEVNHEEIKNNEETNHELEQNIELERNLETETPIEKELSLDKEILDKELSGDKELLNTGDESERELETKETNSELERLRAIKSLSDIEATLSQVCDRLHEQQLLKFDLEIKMCTEGTHPSLRQYRERINGELSEKLTRIGNLLCYQMNSIHTESRAGRCAAMQTYMKNRIQLRTDMLNAVTERWYKTNRERQQMLMGVPEYGYSGTGLPRNVRRTPVPKMGVRTHPTLLKMPAAPSMPYLTDAERDEDLRSLGLR